MKFFKKFILYLSILFVNVIIILIVYLNLFIFKDEMKLILVKLVYF